MTKEQISRLVYALAVLKLLLNQIDIDTPEGAKLAELIDKLNDLKLDAVRNGLTGE